MPYTVPLAEVVGGIVGIAVGRFCAKHGRRLAREWGLPEFIGGFTGPTVGLHVSEFIGGITGATIGHYLSGTVTKVCINAMGLDFVGVAISTGLTTPVAALSHGLVEGLTAGLQDLGVALEEIDIGDFVNDLLSSSDLQPQLEHMAEAMSNPAPVTIDEHITMTPLDNSAALASANDFEIADNEDYSLLAAHGPMPPPNVHSLHGFVHDDDLRFSGSSQPISLIADLQAGPTCALETLENMVQAKNPLVGNNLSDWVIQSGWYNPETMGPFPIAWYQHVLSQCGIGSQWVDASPQALLNTISGSNTTAAIMGDPYFLDNPSYKMPGGELHAVTLIEPWIDQSGQAMGFIGIDSNVAGKPCFWSFDQVAQFIGNARQRLGAYGGKALVTL